jgi:hypothetical protein
VTLPARLKELVDVAGLEPATPCLQRTEGKTLTALSGVAYTENQRNFCSLKYPEVFPNEGSSFRVSISDMNILPVSKK